MLSISFQMELYTKTMDLQSKNRVKNQKIKDRKLLYTNQNAKTNQKTTHIIPQDQSCTKQFQNTLKLANDILLRFRIEPTRLRYLQESTNYRAVQRT
jgi:hypothetical protein